MDLGLLDAVYHFIFFSGLGQKGDRLLFLSNFKLPEAVAFQQSKKVACPLFYRAFGSDSVVKTADGF